MSFICKSFKITLSPQRCAVDYTLFLKPRREHPRRRQSVIFVANMLFTGSPDDSEDCVMGPQRFRYTAASEPLELIDSQSSALLIAASRSDDKLSAVIAHRPLQEMRVC